MCAWLDMPAADTPVSQTQKKECQDGKRDKARKTALSDLRAAQTAAHLNLQGAHCTPAKQGNHGTSFQPGRHDQGYIYWQR